jgi:hypothetical protein
LKASAQYFKLFASTLFAFQRAKSLLTGIQWCANSLNVKAGGRRFDSFAGSRWQNKKKVLGKNFCCTCDFAAVATNLHHGLTSKVSRHRPFGGSYFCLRKSTKDERGEPHYKLYYSAVQRELPRLLLKFIIFGIFTAKMRHSGAATKSECK